MDNHILLRLDWPVPSLWPNNKDKAHWSDTAKAKKKAKATAGWLLTKHRHAIRACQHRHLTLTFYPPHEGRYDLDNAFAAMKAQLDALRDVWGVDDSEWTFTLERGEKLKGGAVAIEIGARPMVQTVPLVGSVR